MTAKLLTQFVFTFHLMHFLLSKVACLPMPLQLIGFQSCRPNQVLWGSGRGDSGRRHFGLLEYARCGAPRHTQNNTAGGWERPCSETKGNVSWYRSFIVTIPKLQQDLIGSLCIVLRSIIFKTFQTPQDLWIVRQQCWILSQLPGCIKSPSEGLCGGAVSTTGAAPCFFFFFRKRRWCHQLPKLGENA